jgi:glycosyltransferase involved in cell wall biosynthesis
MRIVIAGSSFFKDGGGIAPYNRELTKALVNEGHDVLAITSEQLDFSDWEINHSQKVPVFSTVIPKTVNEELRVAKAMFERVVQFDPDVLISSNHVYLTSLFPCFADRRRRITISHFYNGILPKLAACRAQDTDWIVALSHFGKSFLTARPNCIEKQVAIVYNSVEDVTFNVTENIARKMDEKTFRIVFPGGSSRHKSPDVIFKTIMKLAKTDLQWELIWLGPAEKYKRKIPSGISNSVIFTGLVSRAEAEQHILKAHCFILPSKHEGCPMSLLEAIRGGVIPLVSDCPSAMREIIKNGISGYVIPVGNSDMIANRLIEIAGNRSLREKLMREARNAYETQVTIPIWMEKMSTLITQRRSGRSKLGDTDIFNPQMVIRWPLKGGRWYKPTVSYLRTRFAFPIFTPIRGSSQFK